MQQVAERRSGGATGLPHDAVAREEQRAEGDHHDRPGGGDDAARLAQAEHRGVGGGEAAEAVLVDASDEEEVVVEGQSDQHCGGTDGKDVRRESKGRWRVRRGRGGARASAGGEQRVGRERRSGGWARATWRSWTVRQEGGGLDGVRGAQRHRAPARERGTVKLPGVMITGSSQ